MNSVSLGNQVQTEVNTRPSSLQLSCRGHLLPPTLPTWARGHLYRARTRSLQITKDRGHRSKHGPSATDRGQQPSPGPSSSISSPGPRLTFASPRLLLRHKGPRSPPLPSSRSSSKQAPRSLLQYGPSSVTEARPEFLAKPDQGTFKP